MLSTQKLQDIAYVTSLIKGRITPPEDFHVEAWDENKLAHYDVRRYNPGYNFHLAIRMIEALLRAHDFEPYYPNDAKPAYGSLPVKLQKVEGVTPTRSSFSEKHLRRIAVFAATLHFDKTKDEFRYIRNQNGVKVGEPIEHPDNFSAGKDVDLLGYLIEWLTSSFGIEVFEPLHARQYDYEYYEDAVAVIEQQLKPAVSAAPVVSTPEVSSLQAQIVMMQQQIQLLLTMLQAKNAV